MGPTIEESAGAVAARAQVYAGQGAERRNTSHNSASRIGFIEQYLVTHGKDQRHRPSWNQPLHGVTTTHPRTESSRGQVPTQHVPDRSDPFHSTPHAGTLRNISECRLKGEQWKVTGRYGGGCLDTELNASIYVAAAS